MEILCGDEALVEGVWNPRICWNSTSLSACWLYISRGDSCSTEIVPVVVGINLVLFSGTSEGPWRDGEKVGWGDEEDEEDEEEEEELEVDGEVEERGDLDTGRKSLFRPFFPLPPNEPTEPIEPIEPTEPMDPTDPIEPPEGVEGDDEDEEEDEEVSLKETDGAEAEIAGDVAVVVEGVVVVVGEGEPEEKEEDLGEAGLASLASLSFSLASLSLSFSLSFSFSLSLSSCLRAESGMPSKELR